MTNLNRRSLFGFGAAAATMVTLPTLARGLLAPLVAAPATPAIITSAADPSALWPGIRAWWAETYAEDENQYAAIFGSDES